jgi:hypothetical protein
MSQTELLQEPAPETTPPEPAHYFSTDDLQLYRRDDRKAVTAAAGLVMTISGLALLGYVFVMFWLAGGP